MLLFFLFFDFKRFTDDGRLIQSLSRLEVSPVQSISPGKLTAPRTLTLGPYELLFQIILCQTNVSITFDRLIGMGPIMASIGSRAYLYYLYNSSDIDLGVVGYLARQISEFRHCCIFLALQRSLSGLKPFILNFYPGDATVT